MSVFQITVLFAAMAWSCNAAPVSIETCSEHTQTRIEKFESRKKGHIIQCESWTDKLGKHVVAIYQWETGKLCEKNYRSEIFAEKYFLSDTIRLEWDVWDYGSNPCEQVMLIDSSLIVFDLNEDGVAETRFVYQFAHDCCDPIKVKYMLHHGNSKLAVRGEIMPWDKEETSFESPRSLDKAFDEHPEIFKEFAVKDWQQIFSVGP